ncbi:hypothetical protein ACO0QE_000861 [Hanseniaspora vineae]
MSLPSQFLKRSALSNVTNTTLGPSSANNAYTTKNVNKTLSNKENFAGPGNNHENLTTTTSSFHNKEYSDFNNGTNSNDAANASSSINAAAATSTIAENNNNNNNNNNNKVYQNSQDNNNANVPTSRSNSYTNVIPEGTALKPCVVEATGLISQTRHIANSSKINGHSTAISELQDAIQVSKQRSSHESGAPPPPPPPPTTTTTTTTTTNTHSPSEDHMMEDTSNMSQDQELLSHSSIRKQPLDIIREDEASHAVMGQSSRIASSSSNDPSERGSNGANNINGKNNGAHHLNNNRFEQTGKRPISTLVDSSELKKFKPENNIPLENYQSSASSSHSANSQNHAYQSSDQNLNEEQQQQQQQQQQQANELRSSGVATEVLQQSSRPNTVYYEYEWEDLDAEDSNDPFMVSEYVVEIFEYLHKLEYQTAPVREDMFKHPNINQNRDILVNWMVKIHNKFGLLPETLFLALNIMDRFLCKERVQLDKLQLVGTASLFIACKYEEVYSPSCKHFAQETDGACDEEEIKEGEKFILQTLNFQLNYPNPMNFLRRISKADDYDIQSRTLAKYLLEITVVDFRFVGELPSKCAAAAMFLSRKMLGKGYWDGNLIHYSGGYTKMQLESICLMMMEYLEQPVVHDEFYKKYASRKFMKASVISRQWAKKVISQGYNVMSLHEN